MKINNLEALAIALWPLFKPVYDRKNGYRQLVKNRETDMSSKERAAAKRLRRIERNKRIYGE